MLGIGAWKQRLPSPEQALPGRAQALPLADRHAVLGHALTALPPGMREVIFALGCFWGAERAFWSLPGVYTTAAGYSGGHTPHPTYREVCSGQTAHAEAVRVVYEPGVISIEMLLKVFWECHDPTQGMRQGNDTGTQYRSAIYACDVQQLAVATASRIVYQRALSAAGQGMISTEVAMAGAFYYAEDEHQQYLAKHPDGYCGLAGTGVACPLGLGVVATG
ncbi:peptide-methionine (S)-S-oxide reductase MsrA [Metallibacterium sp.]|uniref:peptide-methionine (S)-S-oxide reductase MsrA n=1 Tax=Metallibacterium sp. TaxID=2940281 RepID=UPI00261449E6|nr:peptide-methionine (S)-S-oxide reductase MsrA [Metallibacterium sp.]